MLTVYRRPQTMLFEGTLGLDALKLHDAIQETNTLSDTAQTSTIVEQPAAEVTDLDSKFTCRPLSQWDCLAPRGVPKEIRATPEPVLTKAPPLRGTSIEPRFQRFIRGMEDAGSNMILNQLKGKWHESDGEEVAADEVCIVITVLYNRD